MKTAAVFSSLKTFLEASRDRGLRLVICYADRSGHTVMIWRETDAWIGALDLAKAKAWTAVAFSGPTPDEALDEDRIEQLTELGQPLYGMQSNKIVFGGGLPIYVRGKLHGSVGVAGSLAQNDLAMAQLAVDSYLDAYEELSVANTKAPVTRIMVAPAVEVPPVEVPNDQPITGNGTGELLPAISDSDDYDVPPLAEIQIGIIENMRFVESEPLPVDPNAPVDDDDLDDDDTSTGQ